MKPAQLIIFGILSLMILISSISRAESAENWLSQLQARNGVYQELAKFPGLPESYVRNLPNLMKSKMLQEMKASLAGDLSSQTCSDQIRVEFPGKVTSSSDQDSHVRDFESQFIHIEMKKCLAGVKAAKVARTYVSREYQSSAFDTVVEHHQEGNRICQVTEAMGLGRSSYCFDQMLLELDGASFIHSYNDFNQDGMNAPVYFREIMSAAYDLPQGTLFYSSVYVRSVGINSFLRGIAKSKIQSSEDRAMKILNTLSQKP